MKAVKQVVIIGAGPAGLTAAWKLLQKGYKVTILEADKQVGGISKTIDYKGNKMDIGGHRFFTKEKTIEKIWLQFLPLQGKGAYDDKILNTKKEFAKKGPDPDKANDVMLVRNRVSRVLYENKFYDYPVTLNFQTIKNLGFFKTILCGFSYLKYRIFKKPENNLEDFYINRFGKKLYSIFFKDYTEKVWGRKPSDISKEWGYQRVRGISITALIKNYLNKLLKKKQTNEENSLISKFYYPKYGPGQLYESMALKIKQMGGKILLNSKVIKVNNDKKIKSIVYEKNGKNYTKKADILISSMPIKDLIESLDNVPKDIYDIAINLPYRDFITVGLLVPSLEIKNQTKIKTIGNIIPDCWVYVQEAKVKLGRIQIFNNWSPYLIKDKNKIWLGLEYFCKEGDSFWNLTDKEIAKHAQDDLIKLGICSKFLDSCVIKVKKAYPAYFDSYKDFDKVKDYLNSFENLYCIGRNGQHRYDNMDHAMMSGIECAKAIINHSSKESIWNVNTDKSYNEVPK